MGRTKSAIACQGGSSRTAFTTGAIRGLLESDARQDFAVVGVNGTCGGAVCVTLVWYALRKQEHPLWKRLIDFCGDNTVHGWAEEGFNEIIGDAMGMANRLCCRWVSSVRRRR